MSSADDEASAVAAAITRYLRTHPGAADTVPGAARWWLGGQPSEDAVERAMTLLVERGIVERHVLPDGTTVFRGGGALGKQATEGRRPS